MKKDIVELMGDFLWMLTLVFVASGIVFNWLGFANIPWNIVFLPVYVLVYISIVLACINSFVECVKEIFKR